MADAGSTTYDIFQKLLSPLNFLQGVIALAILGILYLISLQNYILFHSIVETAGIAVAFSIFIIVWNTRRRITDAFFLIIGISFLFTGGIDLVHMLAYKGMGVFPGNSSDLPTQLWIAARYFQSITFLAATFLIGRSITREKKYDIGIIFTVCSAASALLLASIFVWQNFPHCFIEGIGLTPFKILSEYLISVILVITIAILYLKRDYFDPYVWKLLIAAQMFLVLGELAFTSYVSVYGFMNMLGHLFRLISVYLFYRVFVVVGITRPFDLLFLEFKKHAAERSRLAAIVENTDDAIISKTLNGIITSWNAGAEKIYGYSAEEAIGKHISILIPPEHAGDIGHILERVGNGDLIRHYETTRIRKDGSKILVSITISPVKDADGRIMGASTIARDISEQKRAADALLHANKKLNLLSSITRHDINNQLMALSTFLELSGDCLHEPDQLAEYISKEKSIAEAITRQISFTKDYEEIGIKAPSWQNVAGIIRKAAAILPVRNIRLDTGRPDLEVHADPLFEKVFYNLIDNALRYGGPGMTTIRIVSQESDQGLIIAVEDDGIGISAEDKKRLFTRGFGHNTGLGLFLSREILSITGITIMETGIPGKGARFEIIAPKGVYRFSANTPKN